jgi:hypothetical protein
MRQPRTVWAPRAKGRERRALAPPNANPIAAIIGPSMSAAGNWAARMATTKMIEVRSSSSHSAIRRARSGSTARFRGRSKGVT